MSDIQSGRLSAQQLRDNFADAQPPLSATQALVEAERCHYCFDAPCTRACPTGIDVPSFIRRIALGDLRGAADGILQANVLGGMCARVCPTETLCEAACVRHDQDEAPVRIGRLQRFATDAYFDTLPNGEEQGTGLSLFTRSAATGKKVAVVGAGPAGLACAHQLARLGHAVTLFEAKDKLGGLNEYGLAAYKTTDDFAQKEIRWLLSIGGITVKTGQRLGQELALAQLQRDFDAVFLGVGLGGVQALGIEEPALKGLRAAVDFIAELRQASDKARVPVGRRVVVVGGGMTAIDAAVQARLLGAEEVTIVYRRGQEHMPASKDEQQWAQTRGVKLRLWATPKVVQARDGAVCGVTFACTRLEQGRLTETNESFTLEADMLLKAVGQTLLVKALDGLEVQAGKLVTNAARRTALPKVWAGGDCRANGKDLTVAAVEDGKQAALDIHRVLSA